MPVYVVLYCIVLYCNPPPTCHCRHRHECGRPRQPTPTIGACAAGRLIGAEGRGRQKAYVHDCRHRERAEEVHNLSLRGPLHSCAGDRGKAALRDEDASLAVNLVGMARKPRAETRECTYYEVVNNTATLCHLGICQSAVMVKSLLVYGQASRDLSCALQLGVGDGVGWSRGDHQW